MKFHLRLPFLSSLRLRLVRSILKFVHSLIDPKDKDDLFVSFRFQEGKAKQSSNLQPSPEFKFLNLEESLNLNYGVLIGE